MTSVSALLHRLAAEDANERRSRFTRAAVKQTFFPFLESSLFASMEVRLRILAKSTENTFLTREFMWPSDFGMLVPLLPLQWQLENAWPLRRPFLLNTKDVHGTFLEEKKIL